MQIIHKEQTKEFKNSDVCIATEYPMTDKDINVAVVVITGRYPEKGRVMNEVCKKWRTSWKARARSWWRVKRSN